MNPQETAGPDVDVDFFEALRTVFEKYPDVAQKYSIRRLHHEFGKLKIDFDKQIGVSRVDGNRIVTEFRGISDTTIASSHHACCQWHRSGGRWRCVFQCLE